MTGLEILSIVHAHLSGSQLMTDTIKPNGELCLMDRPLDSEKEDVVINLLTNSLEVDVSECILNVNVFVPNLVLTFSNGNVDRSQPDFGRLKYLGKLAVASLRDVWHSDGTYTFTVQQETVFPDKGNQHYLNIRVEFNSIE